jgi:hypothetical protein
MTCARKTVLASVVFLAFVMVLPSLAGSPAPLANKVYGVTLTPEQEAQLKVFNSEAEPAIKAIKADASLSREEKEEQVKAIRDGIKENLRVILSPEQAKDMSAAPSTPNPKGFIVKALGVTPTPEQEAQFRAILAEAEPAMKAIRESKLSEAEKKEQMQAVYDDINNKLTALVNPK